MLDDDVTQPAGQLLLQSSVQVHHGPRQAVVLSTTTTKTPFNLKEAGLTLTNPGES